MMPVPDEKTGSSIKLTAATAGCRSERKVKGGETDLLSLTTYVPVSRMEHPALLAGGEGAGRMWF